MPDPYNNPTAREFLAARARWLRVVPVVTVDNVRAGGGGGPLPPPQI